MIACRACGARWDQNLWTAGCATCGGAALERPCELCEGTCGQIWSRAVLDSNERKRPIWNGGCGLPVEEQRAHLTARYPAADFSNYTFHQVTAPAPPPPPSPPPSPPPPRSRLAETPPPPTPPPPDHARQLVDALIARSRGSDDLAARVALHQKLVNRTAVVQRKWAGIRENLAFGDRETAEWAKGNARYAGRVSGAIGELDPARFPTCAALREAASILVVHSWWDLDYDDPTSARDDFHAAIRTA